MPLTDTAIRNAKPSTSTVKMSDGGGLQLWVTPKGAKLWCLAFRFDGKQKKLSVGPYPEIDLRTARARREEARAQLRAGLDPSSEKRLQKLTRETSRATTFGLIADELLAKKEKEGRAATTMEKKRWLLTLAAPLVPRPVVEISAAEALAVLRKVEARGQHETAKALRTFVGQVFRYAIATARAENDPTFGLRGALIAPTVTHRAAIITSKEFGALLRAVDGFTGQMTTKAALQLMALLFPRPGELRLAEWPEFDLDAAEWLIPAKRTKMRRPHRVPLPRQAVDILKALQEQSGEGRFVFPSLRTNRRPISENTTNAALRRMGFAQDEMTSHGFRAAASTMLNESGLWSSDTIERALAHQDEDEVRRAYARGQYWDERVRMAQWWADKLDTLRDGAKVISMTAKTG
jgi:integrase